MTGSGRRGVCLAGAGEGVGSGDVLPGLGWIKGGRGEGTGRATVVR